MRPTQHRTSRHAMVAESLAGDKFEGEVVDVLNTDGAESALLDLQESAQQAENAEVHADELENAAISLESLVEVAQKSLDTDGLDEASAELLQTAVENQLAPLAGAVPVEEIIPAMESFASPSSRRESTVMVIESITEQAKALWAKVRQWIQNIRDFFKKMWINAKQAVTGLQRRVKSLKTELGNRNFSMPKSGGVELKDGRWAVSAADITVVAALIKTVLNDYNKEAVKYANSVASALNGGKTYDATGSKKAVAVSKLDGLAGKSLPGSRKFVSTDNGYLLQTESTEVKAYSGKPLSETELNGIVDALDSIATDVIAYERGFQEKDRAEEAVLKAGDKFAKAAKDKDDATKVDARTAFNQTRDAANALNNPTREIIKYASSLLSGVGGFVASNLKHYDKK